MRLIDRSISYIKWRTGWGGLTYYRTVKINNKALRVPLFRGVGYDNLTNPESYLDGIFKRILMSESGAVLDVGVNIGQTLLKIASLDEKRRYIGFEPNTFCSYYADLLLKVNGLDNFSVIPIGLSSESSIKELLLRSDYDDAASVIDQFRPASFYSRKKYIYLTNGDSVIDALNLGNISILKIDTEGAELEVLQGFRGVLENHKPYIFFEVLPDRLLITNKPLSKETIAFRRCRTDRMEELLHSHNYQIYRFKPDGSIVRIGNINADINNEKYTDNYFALPYEKEIIMHDIIQNTIQI